MTMESDKDQILWHEYRKKLRYARDEEIGSLNEEIYKIYLGRSYLFKPLLTVKQTDPNQLPISYSLSNGAWRVRMMILNDLPKGSKLLEVGCGQTFFPLVLVTDGYTYEGVDCMEGLIKACNLSRENIHEMYRERLHFSCCLAENLPFDDHTFDAVFGIDFLEHLRDVNRFLKEALRVLKPHGLLYFTTPVWINCDSPEHLHYFTEQELRNKFAPFDIQIEHARYNFQTIQPNTFVVRVQT